VKLGPNTRTLDEIKDIRASGKTLGVALLILMDQSPRSSLRSKEARSSSFHD